MHPEKRSTMTIPNAITVDLEDWFQGIEQPFVSWGRFESRLRVGLDRLLDILDQSGVKATFFVLGWIAEKHPEIIRQIVGMQHEIASHGYNHEKLYDMTPDSFVSHLERAKKVTEDAAGQPVLGHRAPFFSLTRRSLWAVEGLCRLGFTFDSSVYPGTNWRYGIPGSPETPYRVNHTDLIEFPVSVFRLGPRRVGLGGAYFRILPLSLTMAGIREINTQRGPAMFYIHPWEFDPGHPLVRFRWLAMATHYFNLRATAPRFRQMLTTGSFNTMSATLEGLQAQGPLPTFTLS
jgi:polysaccharide deacetylase family protein (PEP-CTERM system associated)